MSIKTLLLRLFSATFYYQLLRSDQKFFNLKRKYKDKEKVQVLLNVQNSHRDYLYKVPSFLTVCQNVFLYSSSGIFFTLFDTAQANDFSFVSLIKLLLM